MAYVILIAEDETARVEHFALTRDTLDDAIKCAKERVNYGITVYRDDNKVQLHSECVTAEIICYTKEEADRVEEEFNAWREECEEE